MPLSHLPIDWLAELDQRLRNSALEGTLNLDYLATCLQERGLFNFRYFSFSDDYITREQFFVLRYCTALQTRSSLNNLNSFYCSKAVYRHDFNHRDREIFLFLPDTLSTDLKMNEFYSGISATGAHSALLPMFAGTELSGKLCVSWEGGERELLQSDVDALRILSGLVGRYARLSDDARLQMAYERIERISLSQHCDLDEKIREFLLVINGLIPSYLIASFEYNWAVDQLTKTIEIRSERIGPDHLDEVYEQGKYLTGEALSAPACKIILDLDNAFYSGRVSVDRKSFEHHKTLIQRPLSVLYDVMSTERRKYVIRLFARDQRLSTRFDNADRRILAYCIRRFARKFDSYWTGRSVAFLSKLSQEAISQFRHPEILIKTVGDEYRGTFEHPVVLIAASKTSDTVDHVIGLSDNQADVAARIETKVIEQIRFSVESRINKHSVNVFDK